MNPTFYENDTITVKKFDDYEIGDVLVFTYKLGELLVHRLLDKKEGLYFCKGDNSFRLEDISKNQIAGRVIRLNHRPLAPCSKQLITLSYQVNRAFVNCRYDIEKTKQTKIYQLYEKTFLKERDTIMKYKTNEAMDYIQTDETSLAVFDPETGHTHFFDETGTDILSFLSEPCGLEELLEKLCGVYEAAPGDIRGDVEEFLREVMEKGVVVEA